MKNHKNIFKLLYKTALPFFSYLLLFKLSFAQASFPIHYCSLTGISNIKDLVYNFLVGCLLTNIVYIILAASVVLFFYGVVKLILSSSSETEKKVGKSIMYWGIIGIFVMVSVWGLISILQNTFGTQGYYDITPRQTLNIQGM